MFKIRNEQMQVFQPAAEAVFAMSVAEYLRKEHAGAPVSLPDGGGGGGGEKTIAELPDELLGALVEGGIAQARRHGLELKSDLTSFVTTMVLAAPNFDAHPDAKKILGELAAAAPDDPKAAGELFQKFMQQMPEESWREVDQNYDAEAWSTKSVEHLSLSPEETAAAAAATGNWQDEELLRTAQETSPSPISAARGQQQTAGRSTAGQQASQQTKPAASASGSTAPKKPARKPAKKRVLRKKAKDASLKQQPLPVAPVQACPNYNYLNLNYTYNSKRAVSFADYMVCDPVTEEPVASGKLNAMGWAHVPNLPERHTKYIAKFSSDPQPFTPFADKRPKPHNLTPQSTQVVAVKEDEKEEDGVFMSVARWIGTALAGDFAEDQTYGQIAFGTVVTLIPVVDQIGDVRDIVANLYHLIYKGRHRDFGPWFGLVTSLIGCVPAFGSLLKGACKALYQAAKRGMGKLPFDQLAVYLNTFGEGNVKDFLVRFSKEIPAYIADITDKVQKILKGIEKKLIVERDRILAKMVDAFEDRLGVMIDGVRALLDLAPAQVKEVMNTIGGHLKDTLGTVKDFAIEVQARADNGARQLKAKLFNVGRKVDPARAAKEAGMHPSDVQRLINHCRGHDRLVVMRFTNEASLKYHKLANAVPKPLDVKLKTAKKGTGAGLVMRPKEPMEDWEKKNIKELEAKGYKFDKEGYLLDPQNNKIYGDHDIQSVHQKGVDEDGKKTYFQDQTNIEDSDTVRQMNTEPFLAVDEKGNFVALENPRSFGGNQAGVYRHGANDNFMVKAKLDAKGRPVKNEKGEFVPETYPYGHPEAGKPVPATVEDMNSGRAFMGRKPGEDEQFLVVTEDGDLLVMDTPEQLEEFHRVNGLIWEYDPTPAIAPAGRAQLVLSAERATRDNEQQQAPEPALATP